MQKFQSQGALMNTLWAIAIFFLIIALLCLLFVWFFVKFIQWLAGDGEEKPAEEKR